MSFISQLNCEIKLNLYFLTQSKEKRMSICNASVLFRKKKKSKFKEGEKEIKTLM